MRMDIKAKGSIPVQQFADLNALKAWHQRHIVYYQKEAQRLANTAAATRSTYNAARIVGMNKKVKMHESAVRVIQAAEDLMVGAVAVENAELSCTEEFATA